MTQFVQYVSFRSGSVSGYSSRSRALCIRCTMRASEKKSQ